jgi:hypothetical protein
MTSTLYCASCRRSNKEGANGVKTFMLQGMEWCTNCADIKQTNTGTKYVSMPSPGRMFERKEEDPLSAWEDCYAKKIKKRIIVKKAKSEIQRAWELWEEDKSNSESMFGFFCWLTRFRPYFLTFRSKGDPWQTVHSWLIQYENKKGR